VAQDFVTGVSILVMKWQDQVENYDSFRQQTIKIVSLLGPPFKEGPGKEVED
jgi:hypothetical protein